MAAAQNWWESFWKGVYWEGNEDDALNDYITRNIPTTNPKDFFNAQSEEGLSGVYMATLHSKHKTLKTLLENGADTELGVDKGMPSALAIAFRNQDIEAAKLLIMYGANTAIKPQDKWTDEQKAAFETTKRNIWKEITPDDLKKGRALEKALERNDKTMAMVFASYGAPIDHREGDEPSALDIAIKNSDFEMFHYMVHVSREVVNLNHSSTDGHDTYLNEALSNLPASEKIVKELLQMGADVNKMSFKDNKIPWDVLKEVAEKNHNLEGRKAIYEISKMMIEKGMLANEHDKTPAEEFAAAMNLGDHKKLNILISLGAAENATKSNGDHYFYEERDLGNLLNSGDEDKKETAKLWIENNLYVNGSDRIYDACFKQIQNDGMKVSDVEKWMKLGLDPNAQNTDGDSWLVLAARNEKNISPEENLHVGEILLDAGANVNTPKDKEGRSPLMNAILNNAQNHSTDHFIDFLLSKNADPMEKDKDLFTALHHAVDKGDMETVKKLLKKGVFVDAQTKNGDTALHFAVKNKDLEMAKLLINAGASIYKSNNKNATPISMVEDVNDVSFANDLKKAYDDRTEDPLSVKWKNIGNKYGVIIMKPITSGGKYVEKTCRAIEKLWNKVINKVSNR